MERIATAWAIFQGLLLEAIPFLLLGVLIAGLARWLVPQSAWVSRLPSNPVLAPITGALMGFALPACECGNVPVARRLLASGAPLGTGFGFLFAAPVLNPIVLASTWAAFPDQPWLLVARPLGAFLLAILLSLLLVQLPEAQLLETALLSERRLSQPLRNLDLLQRGSGLIGEPLPAVMPAKPQRPSTREVLPVLVGWFGCKRSHLRKYAKMYADIGYDNVVCVIPPAAATLFPALGDAFAASALESVAKAKARIAERTVDFDEDSVPLETTPDAVSDASDGVVLHIFSNGGYLFAGNVMHAQTGFVADTETPLGDLSTALRRKLGFAPDPKLARDFTQNVVALVVDSAPGELEPGMVAASFEAVLEGKAAPDVIREDRTAPAVSAGAVTLQQTAAAMLAWPPIAKRLRYIDAAWGGFPAVTGNRWSGDARSKQGNAAEVAFASAERKLQALRLANEDGARTKAKIQRNLCDERPGERGLLWCPAMFMYSRADPIIPFEQVEAFATARAMRLGRSLSAATDGRGAGGGLVTVKAWDDAPHCEIGRVDPAGYQQALGEFLAPPDVEECEGVQFSNNVIKPWDRD